MKMKYLSYLNAIMTLAMVCLQAAPAFSSVFENGALDNHHYVSTSVVDNSTKDLLNNMTLGELKELKQEVTQEMLRKHMAEINDSFQSEPASRDRLYNESVT
jgi:hypothetical protein